MKQTCIIIEDEPLALERTRSYVERHTELQLLGSFDNALSALTYLRNNPADIVFLDINLGEFSGIQFLETNLIKAKVIITTAYPEFALRGFDLNVTDYLLKPFTFERFITAVSKAISANAFPTCVFPTHAPSTSAPSTSALTAKAQPINGQKTNPVDSKTESYIFIKTEYRLEKVMLSDILYIEGMRDYRRLHLVGKKIMTLQTFKELEVLLPPNKICRVHKSYMVSISKIDSIERERIKINGEYIPVSETYKHLFQKLIGG